VKDIEHQRGPTFLQVLEGEYDGNLKDFSKTHGINYTRILEIASGRVSKDRLPGIIQKVCRILNEAEDVLFPDDEYPHLLFDSIADAPGYKLILQKHSLHFKVMSQDNGSLRNFFLDRGFSINDYSLFTEALRGANPVLLHGKLILKVCEALGMGIECVFPQELYAYEWRYLKNKETYLEDQNDINLKRESLKLRQCEEDIHKVQNEIVDRILSTLEPDDRKILEMWYGVCGSDAYSQSDIAEACGKNSKQSVQLALKRLVQRLRKKFFQFDAIADDARETMVPARNDRIFI